MYKIEELTKYDFFKNADVNFVLDSLTGLVSRQYILAFAKDLIKNNIPFAFAMVDLDNFKSINDNYGHHAGDICLKNIAEGIQERVGDGGIVGRFGGDEFIIVYLKNNDYDSIHKFYEHLYYDDGPLRKIINLENNKVFITATVGSASFPIDADNYDELFAKMDKALYRGKIKGRNCYIIYVHSKHKDIVIKQRDGNTLLHKFENITRITQDESLEHVRINLIDYLYRVLHPYNVIYVNKENFVQSGNNTKYYYYYEYDPYTILDNLLIDMNIISGSDPNVIITDHPETKDYVESRKIHAYVIVRVGKYGFIMVLENNISRIWQDQDLALLYFAATELKNRLDKK